MVLVACIATLAMCASCDKDDNDSSANIFTQRIYLNFVTPEGDNLLDANAFADYGKGYKTAQDYFCDDRISILCRRKSDGKTADFIDKGNPTLPYSNFRISHPALNLVQDMSHYNSRPVITRVEYDDDPGNLLDHDPYYRIAQQIGYTQFTNNRAYFYIPITVRRG